MGYAENQARVEQGRMKSLHDFQKQPQMADCNYLQSADKKQNSLLKSFSKNPEETDCNFGVENCNVSIAESSDILLSEFSSSVNITQQNAILNGIGETDGFISNPDTTGFENELGNEELLRAFIEKVAIFYRGFLWLPVPDGKYYQQLFNLNDFCRIIVEILMKKFGARKDEAMEIGGNFKMMKALFELLKIDPDCEERGSYFEQTGNILNVENGVVAVNDGKITFLENVESSVFTYVIRACYDNNVESRSFENFLSGFIGDDVNAHRRFWQLMGHLLFENTSAKSLVWLYGKGDDGKSEFVKFLQKLLMPTSATYSADVMSAFDKHGAAYFQNAKILFLHEANKTLNQSNVDIIKRLTGGDSINVNPKNREMKQVNLSIKILITGNHLPNFAPGILDEALKRRLQFIRVYSVPKSERVENISQILLKDRDYFLTKAINGFADLQTSNFEFASCTKDDDLAKTIFENDIADIFLEECCNVQATNFVYIDSFKKFAEKWLKDAQCEWSVNELRKAIIAKGFLYTRFRANGQNRWGFKGFELKA